MCQASGRQAVCPWCRGPLRSSGIEVHGLVRDFGDDVRAVDGIDLEVAPGEIFGFLGPNGAGKSTTVLMLTTLLPPSEGTARIAGYDLVKEPRKVRTAIGVALQQAALDPFLTAREHVRFQAALHGLPKARRHARGDELLERVGLLDVADRKVGGYSGGMKRRLDLALALIHEPRVLFLDEPTTGLDVRSRTALWEEIGRLAREEGVTVFLTTQYLEEADMLAQRVAIVDRGRIVASDTPERLKARFAHASIEVTPKTLNDRTAVMGILSRFGPPAPASAGGVAVHVRDSAGQLPEIVRAFDGAGLEVGGLRVHAPSLDDVFLAKTGRSLDAMAIPPDLVPRGNRAEAGV
ncbi:MAG: type transport system ATP-binding protein [Solirubrobacteraceae bacterium]|nr:type transport system ATP-binding protein [Solirubrobacteraceae bacterium]